MSYLVLSAIVIAISYSYQRLKSTYNLSKGVRRLFYFTICFALCLFAGLRTEYNDTFAYINEFKTTTNNFSSLFSTEFSLVEVYLFKVWKYVIYNFISKDANVYLFICSLLFVCPAIKLIDKYSKNFTLSIVMFVFGGMYLFSLAGLKQTLATGVILIGLPHLFKKQYFKYYIYCILALGFHAYSMFFMIIPILGNQVFNKRTVLFCLAIIIVGVSLSFFSSVISDLIEILGKDVDEETIETGSVNILRALVYLVPFILTILGRKNLEQTSEPEKWLVKIGILSTAFMVLALFGNPILFGRIPQYFLIGTVITMPLILENVFEEKYKVAVTFVAIVCYVAYGIYGLHIDGAFTKDIFQLIWF